MSAETGPQQLVLEDGRRLGWQRFGDPGGRAVLCFHGYPGCRLEEGLGAAEAAGLGLCLIGIDRPGFGLSDFQPRRSILDWPRDVVALASSLGLERFPVLGISGGGPYVAACGVAIGERITRAAMICGVGPMTDPGAMEGMMRTNRVLFGVARRASFVLRPLMAVLLRSVARHPERFVDRMMAPLPEPDRQALHRPEIGRWMVAMTQEAFRSGTRGAAWEGRLYARDWGFRLEDVACPVDLYQGELDVNVPPVMARMQAARIPGCSPHFYPDEGHLSLPLNRMEEILRRLTAGEAGQDQSPS